MRALTEYGRVYGLRLGLGLLGLILGLAIARLPVTSILLVLGAAAIVVASFAEPLLGIGAALVIGPLRAWLPTPALPLTPARWSWRSPWARGLRVD